MIRHEQPQESENLAYYIYDTFEPFSSHMACITSTRLGGVSEGPLRALNLSFRVGDDEQHVMSNRQRLYRILNIDPELVAQAQLIHGNRIQIVTEQSPKGFYYKFAETDGLVTNVVNRPLFIPVADCAARDLATEGLQIRAVTMTDAQFTSMERDSSYFLGRSLS